MNEYSPPITATTPAPDGVWYMLQFDGSVYPENPGDKIGLGYAITRPVGPAISDPAEIAVAPPSPRSLEHLSPLVTGSITGGPGTNNDAEYKAMIAGMGHALRLGIRRLLIVGDSQLVLYQTAGYWQCKSPSLRKLLNETQALVKGFTRTQFKHLKRDKNERCDGLAKRAAHKDSEVGSGHFVGPTGIIMSKGDRYLTDHQAALMRWLYLARGLKPAMLGRVFDVERSVASRVVHNDTYKDIREEHLWID